MNVISMHQAKSNLSQLVKRAAEGETILIGAYGKVEAKLVAATAETKSKKKIGALAGKLIIPDDFDAPLEDDVVAEFEGR
jgi:antitoxin (DNA-binding transcriptional repressor) of toxin-antitoxin stability system